MFCVRRAGWLNVLGQFAATAANASLLANHIAIMWLLGNGHVFTPVETLLAYASARPLLCPIPVGQLSFCMLWG